MKKTYLFLVTIFVGLIAACGSGEQTDNNEDSLMTDSAVMDSASISMDTTAVTTDKLSTDSTANVR